MMETISSLHPGYSRTVALWPRLTRFYGLPPSDWAEMPPWLLRVYLDAMPELEAEEQLGRIQAASFPQADEKSRKSVHRALVRTVERSMDSVRASSAPTISDPEKDAGTLAAIGIRVKLESVGEKIDA
jgi:hypothetical protein